MILRRLSRSLKEQNWTAIVIEFVLVVAGVFLGIQVSNWNAERETRQKSALFMARLVADLKVEAWGYEYLVEYNTDVLANARRAVDALAGESPLSDEQLVIAAYTRAGLQDALRLRFADVGTVLANLQQYNTSLVNALRAFRSGE
jgi:hypothetical protein